MRISDWSSDVCSSDLSFLVAAYLAYSLHQVDKKTVFVDSVGGMARQQVHAIHAEDLLIAVSYHPYAEETLQSVAAAVDSGCKVLAISDSLRSEEHTSELQSLMRISYAVFCLKKKIEIDSIK